MLGTLKKTEIENLLSSQVVGRIACTDGRQPYIVPVTYTYDGVYIYGQTNEGFKLKTLRKNPNVCFEVEQMLNLRHWQTVVVTGLFEELHGEESKKAKEILFNRIYCLKTSATVHYHEPDEVAVLEKSNRLKPIMYRIKIDKISGRFESE
jgi:nitroimidazol reductase NimA-like FMN-containing flavoprotein (pyridoxamine 5'-phosphate oxidase superfamily)